MRGRCEDAADGKAAYGTPIWPGVWSGGSFGSFNDGDASIRLGQAILIEPDAQFQNEYGAMVHTSVVCVYDLPSKTVTRVNVLGHRLRRLHPSRRPEHEHTVQQAGPPVALEVASVVRRDTCPVGGRVRTAAALLWVQPTSREPALFFSTLARSTRPRRALPPSRGALPFTLCPGAPFPRPSPHIAPPIPATPEPAAPPSLSRLSSGRSPRAPAVRPSSVPRGASS